MRSAKLGNHLKLPVYIPSQAKSEDNIFLFYFVFFYITTYTTLSTKGFFSCAQPDASLRWLNTVLRAVSSSACFKLHKQTWGAKKAIYTEGRFLKIYSLKFCDILAEFLLLSYFK